ncbi:LuxR C-terminal-related transcriptional regulator [Leifsonia sp. H3M29-4]|uniref:LuxR C-terminal-related transcriptional regulator n=1 Tax=Salinibacterium metalliresistens TaxID=3031321 RepID=UPI0023DABC23|nr:LuxR C-terminal-related transcriptional regulator [Salinibacterium metalliresistens]MDF1479310.1 LuxR C-terminal-related transcriptional regulator [Salinibacterium metalliresistens]
MFDANDGSARRLLAEASGGDPSSDRDLGTPAPLGESRSEALRAYDRALLGPDTDESMLAQLPVVDVRYLSALGAAIAAGDFSGAMTTARDGWYDLLLGDRDELRRVLEGMPPAAVRERPVLSMLLGLVYYAHPYLRVKGIRYFVVAMNAARAEQDGPSTVDRALILTSGGVAYRLIGRPERAVGAARSAWRILLQLTEEQRRAVPMLTAVFAQLGMTLYSSGNVDEALDVFEHGLAEAPAEGYRHGFANLSMLAGIHALRGELPEAEEYVQLARDGAWPDVLRSTYSGTFYRIAEAIIALERFDTHTARAHLASMVHDRRTIEHWVEIAITEALVDLVDGKPGAAEAGLHAFASLRKGQGRSPGARARLASTRALLQLALGNPRAASAVLQRDAVAGYAKSIGLARVQLAEGHHGAALQHIRSTSGAAMSVRWLAEAIAIEAASLLRFSEGPRAGAVVAQLGSLLERTHQRVALTLLPDADFQRLAGALSDAGFSHIVSDLPARSRFPDPDSTTLLTDREFAVLQALMRTSSAASIAAEEVVSVNTVKTQLKSLYRKLGVSSRDEAIAIAIDRHLVVDQPESLT